MSLKNCSELVGFLHLYILTAFERLIASVLTTSVVSDISVPSLDTIRVQSFVTLTAMATIVLSVLAVSSQFSYVVPLKM